MCVVVNVTCAPVFASWLRKIPLLSDAIVKAH